MSKFARALVLYGVPAAVGVLSLFHPIIATPTGFAAAVAPRLGWWMTLHFANLVLFALLGFTMYVLLDGVPGRAATVSRLALALYMPLYAGFDALVGLGSGALAQYVLSLPPEQQAAASAAADVLWTGELGNLLAAAGSMAWMVALLSAAVAFSTPGRRLLVGAVAFLSLGLVVGLVANFGLGDPAMWVGIALAVLAMLTVTRPVAPGVLLALSAFLFASGHIPPNGPLAMVCLLAAIAVREWIVQKQPGKRVMTARLGA